MNIRDKYKGVMKMTQFKVFSMFDGVGGFIVGLNNANVRLNSDMFVTTHSNQFEPSRKSQDAFEVGVHQFPEMNHSNQNIMELSNDDLQDMTDTGVNMIVGGFPCQDYSVARSKKMEMGIQGKKGVLFWEIIRSVNHIKPEFLILENVDRLLKSPSSQRGRDFAIMLGAFNQLGYSVEWRVINAADYGHAQRRRRVFFFVYRNDTDWAKRVEANYENNNSDELDVTKYEKYLYADGLFGRKFPVYPTAYKNREYAQQLSEVEDVNSPEYIVDISDNFTGTIWNTGVMRHGRYYTVDTAPVALPEDEKMTLGDVVKQAKEAFIADFDNEEEGLAAYNEYLENYIIRDEAKLEKFKYLRGPKKIERTTAEGHAWTYSEGGMSPYDQQNMPGRTMLTSEGTVNRSTHFLKVDETVNDENAEYRLITPMEAELLQDFPANWTKFKTTSDGKEAVVSDRMRMFFMGNALVTGIVAKIGEELGNIVNEYK